MHRSSRMLLSTSAAPTAMEAPVPDQVAFIESDRSNSTMMQPGSDLVTGWRYVPSDMALLLPVRGGNGGEVPAHDQRRPRGARGPAPAVAAARVLAAERV